jgi:hypothetical protein
MAVWIYAYGRNGLLADGRVQDVDYLGILNSIELDELKILDSIKESKRGDKSIRQHYEEERSRIENWFKSMSYEDYEAYLFSMKYPFIKVDNIVDHFIFEGEKREEEGQLHFNNIYEQLISGKIKSRWEMSNDCSFVNNLCYLGQVDVLRFEIINDLVRISGPFSVFSSFGVFQSKISFESRDYYHSYFKRILKSFKSDFILYAHEWSGLDDVENDSFDYAQLVEQAEWKRTSSKSIHSMDAIYYEQL